MAARWYVVNVYSGSEKKVAASLKEQAVLKNLEDKILDVLVPTEEVVEIKKGAKVNSERKFFPGYILVKMEMSDDTWHVVKDTPRVSGFLGSHNKPQAITEKEVQRIMAQIKPPTPSILKSWLMAPLYLIQSIEANLRYLNERLRNVRLLMRQ